MAKVVIQNLDRCLKKFENIKLMDLKPAVVKATALVKNTAQEYAPVSAINGGELKGSIHWDVTDEDGKIIGKVYTDSEYAAYVEFGTGAMGDGTYPYDINTTLEYTNEAWVYYNEKLQQWVTTYGNVAQPFMYPALADNEERINGIVSDELTKLLKQAVGGG